MGVLSLMSKIFRSGSGIRICFFMDTLFSLVLYLNKGNTEFWVLNTQIPMVIHEILVSLLYSIHFWSIAWNYNGLVWSCFCRSLCKTFKSWNILWLRNITVKLGMMSSNLGQSSIVTHFWCKSHFSWVFGDIVVIRCVHTVQKVSSRGLMILLETTIHTVDPWKHLHQDNQIAVVAALKNKP